MTVTIYRSTDAGAPVLRGNTPGDLINLLNKCLVTGYGSKAAAGWTMPFVGTNVAAFKQGAGSNGMYLRIDDTSAATSNRYASAVGYENMTDVNTGTVAPFPTAAQVSSGIRMYTYATGGLATARAWSLIANSKFFFLLWNNNDSTVYDLFTGSASLATNAYYYKETFMFGDIVPLNAGDLTCTMIFGNSTTSPVTSNTQSMFGIQINAGSSGAPGLYMARNYDGVGGSFNAAYLADWNSLSTYFGGSGLSYPNPADGKMYMCRVMVTTGFGYRGHIPGIWVPCHNASSIGNSMDTFTGSGALAGRTFEIRPGANSPSGYFVEISNTWD